MLRRRLARLPVALALFVVLTAGGVTHAGETLGGGAAALPAASVEADLAALVPAGTHVLVYAPSLEGFVTKLKAVVAAFDEGAAEQISTAMVLEQLPIGPFVDPTKPMAFAMSLPNGPEGPSPEMTAIMAVTDVAQATAEVKAMGIASLPSVGTFVALAMGAEPATRPAAAPAIASALAAGDLVVRVDVGALVALHREMVDGMIGEMDAAMKDMPTAGMAGVDEMMGFMKESMKDFLDGAQTLDLSLGIDGTTIRFKGLLTAKDGSKLMKTWSAPAGGGSLASALPADWPMALLLSFDIRKLYGWMEPMMDSVWEMAPEADRPAMKVLWQKAVGLSQYLGDHHAIAYDLGAQGIRMVMVSEAKDADQYLQAFDALLADESYAKMMSTFGIEMAVLPRTEVAGIPIRHIRMNMDVEKMMAVNPAMGEAPPEAIEAMKGMFAKMFGEEGMLMHAAAVNGNVVMVMGNQALLASVLRRMASGEVATDGALAHAIREAGGKPTFLMHMELRAMLAGTLDMARGLMPPEQADAIPTMPEGGPIPLLLYGTTDGRYASGGYVMDAGAIAELFGYFMGAMEGGMAEDPMEELEPLVPVPDDR